MTDLPQYYQGIAPIVAFKFWAIMHTMHSTQRILAFILWRIFILKFLRIFEVLFYSQVQY